MRCVTAAVLATALWATTGPSPSQHLVEIDPASATAFEQPISNPMFPPPTPPQIHALGMPAPPPGFPSFGGFSIDVLTGDHWYTEGGTVFVISNPAFGGPNPGVVLQAIPIGGLFGPATGLAWDPVGGVLWLSDAFTVYPVLPVPGTPLVPGMLPFGSPAGGGTAALDWDGMTNTLWVADAAGGAIPVTATGAAAGPPILPPGLPPASGIAVDKSGLTNAAGVRSIWVLAMSDALRALFFAWHEDQVRRGAELDVLLGEHEVADLATMVAELAARSGSYEQRVREISLRSESF